MWKAGEAHEKAGEARMFCKALSYSEEKKEWVFNVRQGHCLHAGPLPITCLKESARRRNRAL